MAASSHVETDAADDEASLLVLSQSPITVFDTIAPDLTITTSDGTEFRVHKSFLCIRSPVLRGMIVAERSAQNPVSLAEESGVIEPLLRFCYPVDDPVFDDLRKLWSVRQAASKYEMGDIDARLSRQVRKYLSREPLLVYALACRDGRQTEAREAARFSLRQPALLDYVPELEEITGGAMHQLSQYREKCTKAVVSLSFEWLNEHAFVFREYRHTGACGQMFPAGLGDEGDKTCWGRYVREAKRLLQDRPCGDVVKNGGIVWSALSSAATCTSPGCKSRAYQDFVKFLDLYAQSVDAATKKIAEETSFT